MSNSYKQFGERVGALVDEKNAAYGSSFAASGAFLRLLYPNGLQPEQYAYALLLVRIFDKQMRIATDADALGESPFQDIAGYGLLGATLQEESKSRCGSASESGAVEESKEQNGSAAQPAPRPTTTSAEPLTEPPLTPPSNAPHSAGSNASAALAAGRSRRVNADGLVASALACNRNSECPMCPRAMGDWTSIAGYQPIRFCSPECRDSFLRKVNA